MAFVVAMCIVGLLSMAVAVKNAKGPDCFWIFEMGCVRGRGSPLEGPGVCIGGIMTLRADMNNLPCP